MGIDQGHLTTLFELAMVENIRFAVGIMMIPAIFLEM